MESVVFPLKEYNGLYHLLQVSILSNILLHKSKERSLFYTSDTKYLDWLFEIMNKH